jgi:FkbM family methyltransferase
MMRKTIIFGAEGFIGGPLAKHLGKSDSSSRIGDAAITPCGPTAANSLSSFYRAVVAALRLIPHGVRGKARLASHMLNPVLDGRDVVVDLKGGERFVMPSLREPIAFHCLISGIYEPEVFSLIRRFLPKGGVFLDVGANVGLFSVLSSRIVGSSGRVIAVEASPRVGTYLERNISLNDCANVEQVSKAVSKSGPCRLEFWPAPADHFGMGSLAAQFSEGSTFVEADTLDHIVGALGVSQVDLIKMDIEGFEVDALRGAIGLLTSEHPPTIIFEFVDWAEQRAGFPLGEAQQFLMELGYRLHRIDQDGACRLLDKPIVAGSWNLLAIPRSQAHSLPL